MDCPIVYSHVCLRTNGCKVQLDYFESVHPHFFGNSRISTHPPFSTLHGVKERTYTCRRERGRERFEVCEGVASTLKTASDQEVPPFSPPPGGNLSVR